MDDNDNVQSDFDDVCEEDTEDRHIFKKPVDYTVPKSPPGPYYRPYSIDTCLIFNKEDQARCNKITDEKKNKCANDYLTEMGNWNPFDKEKPPGSDIVERWGKINFLADSLHRHGGNFIL